MSTNKKYREKELNLWMLCKILEYPAYKVEVKSARFVWLWRSGEAWHSDRGIKNSVIMFFTLEIRFGKMRPGGFHSANY